MARILTAVAIVFAFACRSEPAPPHAPPVRRLTIMPGTPEQDLLRLAEPVRPRHLSGRVLDAKGAPVAGAIVRAPDATAVSAKNGGFSLDTTATRLEVRHGRLAAAARVADGDVDDLELHLSDLPRWRVHVQDPSGKPLSGARVAEKNRRDTSDLLPLQTPSADAEALTDEDGVAELVSPAEDARTVVASAPGYLPGTASCGATSPGCALEITLPPAPRVGGTLRTPTSDDIAGARIELLTADAERHGTETDAEGRFDFGRTAPRPSALPDAEQAHELLAKVTTRDGDFTVSLKPVPAQLVVAPHLYRVTGRVLDGDGALVAGAVVDWGPDPQSPPLYRVTSDDDGTYRFLTPSPRIVIGARDPSDIARGRTHEVDLTSVHSPIDVALEPPTRLDGRVFLGGRAGMEEVRARVVLETPASAGAPANRREAVTDPSGRFSFEGLPPGPLRVHAEEDGRISPVRIATRGLEVDPIIPVSPTMTARVLLSDGRPATTLAVGDQLVEVDSGAFTISRDPAARAIRVSAPGHVATEFPVPVADGDVDLGTLRLSAGWRVRGRVVARRSREPVPFPIITAAAPPRWSELGGMELRWSAADGTFELAHTSGEYLELDVAGATYPAAHFRVARQERLPDFALAAGGELEVRVVGPDGQIQPGVLLRVLAPEPPGRWIDDPWRARVVDEARTDADGRALFQGLSPGPRVLLVGERLLPDPPRDFLSRPGTRAAMRVALASPARP